MKKKKYFSGFINIVKKMSLFKIIDIDEKNYICIDSNKNLYQVEKNKELETLNIKICQLLILNYKLNENSKSSALNNIKLNKKLIIKIKKENNIKLKKEEISDLYDKRLKEESKIRIGDIHYSIKEFNKYVEN